MGRSCKEPGWDSELTEALKLKYALIAPVVLAGRSIGLYLLVRSEEPPFSQQEASWLEAIAAHVSMGFERSR